MAITPSASYSFTVRLEINNVLCVPGFFRGLLDSRARLVNDDRQRR